MRKDVFKRADLTVLGNLKKSRVDIGRTLDFLDSSGLEEMTLAANFAHASGD